MNDKIKKFAEKISNDEKLQKKLGSLKANDPDIIGKVIVIAKEEGFDLSKDDFDNETAELTVDEMKAISGAGGCGCLGFGQGGGDGLNCTCLPFGTGTIKGKGGITSQGGCVCTGAGAGATRRH